MTAAQTIFDSIPREDHFELFHGAQPNYEKVVEFLDFTKEDVAKATNVPKSSVRYDNKIPRELHDRLLEWAIAIHLVSQYFDDFDRAMLWFRVPNPLLGGIAPRDMIRIGRFKKLLRFIHNALEENAKP